MLAAIVASFSVLLVFSIALALGQFFGRDPVTPKCNPDTCCMQGNNCTRPSATSPRRP